MKNTLVASFLSAALLVSASGHAALSSYLTLVGSRSGAIKGGAVQRGREEKIPVIAVEHELRNDGSGKKHGLFTITKELDKSSPLLWKALASGEKMATFDLQFYAPRVSPAGGAGAEVQTYTVTLTGARLVEMKFTQPNVRNPELQRFSEYETVSFTYDAISWTWNEGNVTATDTK